MGGRTIFGACIYERDVPEEDAPLMERLRAAGAILIGKTTTPEFGWKGARGSTPPPSMGEGRPRMSSGFADHST